MESLLKKHFGYDKFRPLQLDIINHVLQKKDSLVLMPTGGGKSICFQIPAIQLEGITIVISPLISLMQDQVDSLKANGIKAEFINSTLSPIEIENIKERLSRNEIKLIYIAPERLAANDFKTFLLTLNISLIAIDEAHCISEWGHNFRKDYRSLKLFKTLFPQTPIIALTATATPKVREDILKQLALVNPKTFISSFDRENLNLVVTEKKKAFNKILSLIKKHEGEPIIIYCFSRKATMKLSQKLRENGFAALPYHAGLSSDLRKKNQDLFIKDKVNIIVATIAFGMGIDKPDVRLVIHETFSKSIEGYYQEIGRAGRDGLPSECVLLYSKGDIIKHQFFLKKIYDHSTQRAAWDKLNKMMAYCETTSCRRKAILEYLGESVSKQKCNGCDICDGSIGIIKTTLSGIIKPASQVKPISKSVHNKGLFEKLRALRLRIAREKNCPPYIVFGDVSLREMASVLPKNAEEFLKIKGVGQNKLNNYGESFLEVINNNKNNNNIVPIKRKIRNTRWTAEDDDKLRELFDQAISVNEISKILKRTPTAIRSRFKKCGLI
ncbi:ATP-dependent DNA helicase RecQ [Candidatus Woesearchaeota archaeon]|jgi:ATP-dependent DNA helicase RecQ|nr:ATP-dependent DNA helicase RecQ [Candidatus Woesearchaeota archaeon]MBT6518502.1 ATP-dependent DNA helicase RecQ [Candidatus Woesearchaeota archaeon]MBT7368655.1 ATP-dependent DNA helicase RecQ [Candidatus Woesearchaeota archaeon]